MLKPIVSPSGSKSQAFTSFDAPAAPLEMALILLSIKNLILEYFLKESLPKVFRGNQSMSSEGKISRFPWESIQP